jgi:hypothetical protein
MKMALKDWKKTKVNSGWIFTGKTDFHKGRKFQETDVYIYKKGWFRDEEGYVVVKINYKSDHSRDTFHKFNTEKQALSFARKYMRSH